MKSGEYAMVEGRVIHWKKQRANVMRCTLASTESNLDTPSSLSKVPQRIDALSTLSIAARAEPEICARNHTKEMNKSNHHEIEHSNAEMSSVHLAHSKLLPSTAKSPFHLASWRTRLNPAYYRLLLECALSDRLSRVPITGETTKTTDFHLSSASTFFRFDFFFFPLNSRVWSNSS